MASKALLVGFAPSSPLLKKLRSLAISFENLDTNQPNWQHAKDFNPTHAFVLVNAQTTFALKEIRERFPHILVSLVVTEKDLSAAAVLEDILRVGQPKGYPLELLKQQSDTLIREFEKNIDVGSRIQQKLSGNQGQWASGIEFRSRFFPAKKGSGGNYYDIFEIEERKKLSVLMSESTNHTLIAALLRALLAIEPSKQKERLTSAPAFLEHLRSALDPVEKETKGTIAVTYNVFDRTHLRWDLAGANNLLPLVWRAEKQGFEKVSHPGALSLHPGDACLFATGGLFELMPPVEIKKKLGKLLADSEVPLLELENSLAGWIHAAKFEKNAKEDITFFLMRISPNILFSR